jgi:hypothetical protein
VNTGSSTQALHANPRVCGVSRLLEQTLALFRCFAAFQSARIEAGLTASEIAGVSDVGFDSRRALRLCGVRGSFRDPRLVDVWMFRPSLLGTVLFVSG